MRLSRPRLTIAWMMAVVALAGALLGLWRWKVRLDILADQYALRSMDHSLALDEAMAHVETVEPALQKAERAAKKSPGPSAGGLANPYEESARVYRTSLGLWRAKADYHAMMERKYEEAYRRPWLSVAPDPPQPPTPPDLFELRQKERKRGREGSVEN